MNRLKANCRGADTEIFYDAKRRGEAFKICKGCPVKLECRLEFAGDPYAFAGGMNPYQRNDWVQQNADRKARVVALEEAQRRVEESMKVDTPPPRSDLPAEEIARQVIELFDGSLIGAKDIALKVGISKTKVHRILKAADRRRTPEELLQMAARGGAAGGPARRARANEATVMEMHAQGASVDEMAEVVGVSKDGIYNIRRRLGLSSHGKKADRVMELTREGKNAKQISTEMGISESRVYQIRKEEREKDA